MYYQINESINGNGEIIKREITKYIVRISNRWMDSGERLRN